MSSKTSFFRDRARLSVLAIVGAAVCTSLSGILIRLVEEADGWQILFWRSVVSVIALLLFLMWRHGAGTGDAFLQIGRAGLGVAAAMTGAFSFFVFALLNTTVANVAFTVGLAPVFAALLAWFALGEAIQLRTAVFIGLSLIGMGFMFGDGALTGHILGNLLALATSLLFAITIVLMRHGRRVDMVPAVTIAGVGAAVVGAIAAPEGLAVGTWDLGIIAVMGAIQVALQYILFAWGIVHLPAAQAALISRLSVVLTPLWAWLGIGEVPSLLTLAGGAFVLVAVAGQGAAALGLTRPPEA